MRGTSPRTGREAVARPILFFSHEIKKANFFYFRRGVGYPPAQQEKARLFFYSEGVRSQIGISCGVFRETKKKYGPRAWASSQGLRPQVWFQGLPASPRPGPSRAPNVGPGPNHQKWPESGPESTVWAENRSKRMPGPLRSVCDGSSPLQGAVLRPKKVKKSG